ncbi:MAG: tRNA (adenine(58)-N(1))-methyltransferase catalytic subunit trmt61a [Vezdaea aestivalis]|nr:MAG: tRNA (adenine(58)-N(1))-methyltransferase catalytic subunit trmt61a [Vezdaea aestivalis]
MAHNAAVSEFFDPGPCCSCNSLAILHLRRDDVIATKVSNKDDEGQGYDEGQVTNTRFGSFPHSTLIGLPWGSQVRASKVDTGSRGRRGKSNKRKRVSDSMVEKTAARGEANPLLFKTAEEAATGFLHLLPPTPEAWTNSLPHRTQVVYTPDYSYVLHRLRVRPGSKVIEAGAGSGSFSHAAARAVFNGFDQTTCGHVYSFEFHKERFGKMKAELGGHGLQSTVSINHRDVYEEGFHVYADMHVDAVFLDLPSPWLAIRHLRRSFDPSLLLTDDSSKSVLSLTKPVHLCIFSPCIEQVQRAITALIDMNWTDIEMVELNHKRVEVRREKVGIEETKGAISSPASVEEAVIRQEKVESKFRDFHQGAASLVKEKRTKQVKRPSSTSAFKEGRLVHRSEPDLKTHTSYLVFAILPRAPMGTADPVGKYGKPDTPLG